MKMKRKEMHDEAIYLISNYTENYHYDIARGCAEMAHGIGIITDHEYEKWCRKIDDKRNNFHIMD